MKDYGDDGYTSYENGPYGYDNYGSGYDDYTYKDNHEKKDPTLYKKSSPLTSIGTVEGPKTISAKCNQGDLYISGGFTTEPDRRGHASADYSLLDSLPDLVNQEHDVTLDIKGDPDGRYNFQAFVVCLDTN